MSCQRKLACITLKSLDASVRWHYTKFQPLKKFQQTLGLQKQLLFPLTTKFLNKIFNSHSTTLRPRNFPGLSNRQRFETAGVFAFAIKMGLITSHQVSGITRVITVILTMQDVHPIMRRSQYHSLSIVVSSMKT